MHTGKIDSCWKLAKDFLPGNMATREGKNKDVMLWLRCWQWRYEMQNHLMKNWPLLAPVVTKSRPAQKAAIRIANRVFSTVFCELSKNGVHFWDRKIIKLTDPKTAFCPVKRRRFCTCIFKNAETPARLQIRWDVYGIKCVELTCRFLF